MVPKISTHTRQFPHYVWRLSSVVCGEVEGTRKKCVQSMMAEILLAKYMVIRHVIFGLCMLLCYLNNIFNHYECFYNYKLMVIAHFIDVFPASIFMWMVKSDHSSMSLCFMNFSCKFLDSLTTIMEYFEHSVLK